MPALVFRLVAAGLLAGLAAAAAAAPEAGPGQAPTVQLPARGSVEVAFSPWNDPEAALIAAIAEAVFARAASSSPELRAAEIGRAHV